MTGLNINGKKLCFVQRCKITRLSADIHVW